ncbi:hypothetical protein AAMO2058_000020300 [Amorphochlora amoebiformis]|mmetsp:Transcript_21509/g.33969  ORF Transcript_21509/g.33969 Transcript_21509/m.33969 type:complete len:601 (-) Transcript_21509:65-1867(-)
MPGVFVVINVPEFIQLYFEEKIDKEGERVRHVKELTPARRSPEQSIRVSESAMEMEFSKRRGSLTEKRDIGDQGTSLSDPSRAPVFKEPDGKVEKGGIDDGGVDANVVEVNVPEKIKELLEELKIEEASFVRDDDEEGGHHILITVPLLPDRGYLLREKLLEIGVGAYYGTLAILPIEVYRSAKSRDGLSVLVRPEVEKVVRNAKLSAKIDFDFLALTVVASILAGAGLATNNTVIIVASMLVSPLMGPIVSFTFGTVVSDWTMVLEALISETVAFMFCFLSGVAVGIGFSNWGEDLNWPTSEMESRGQPIALAIGIVIAVPSGVGVALSSLSNNTASLVGVAISAALLPPAVNVGLCFTYAAYVHIYDDKSFESSASEFMTIGGISFALYILNIVCIYFAAVFMFKIKEVYATPTNKATLWFNLRKIRRANRGTLGFNRRELDDKEMKRYYDELRKRSGISVEILEALKGHHVPVNTARLILGNKLRRASVAFKNKNEKLDRGKLRHMFTSPKGVQGKPKTTEVETKHAPAKLQQSPKLSVTLFKANKYYHQHQNHTVKFYPGLQDPTRTRIWKRKSSDDFDSGLPRFRVNEDKRRQSR